MIDTVAITFAYPAGGDSSVYGKCEVCSKKTSSELRVIAKIIRHTSENKELGLWGDGTTHHTTEGDYVCQDCAWASNPQIWFDDRPPRYKTCKDRFEAYMKMVSP